MREQILHVGERVVAPTVPYHPHQWQIAEIERGYARLITPEDAAGCETCAATDAQIWVRSGLLEVQHVREWPRIAGNQGKPTERNEPTIWYQCPYCGQAHDFVSALGGGRVKVPCDRTKQAIVHLPDSGATGIGA